MADRTGKICKQPSFVHGTIKLLYILWIKVHDSVQSIYPLAEPA